MLDRPSAPRTAPDLAPRHERSAPVRLLGLGTALPPHVLPQDEVVERARRLLSPRLPSFDRLVPAFTNAGIERRHSVVPFEWFDRPHGWTERNRAYLDGATALFEAAAREALDAAGLAAAEVDTIVTVSSSGIATPTLEARAARALGFRADVHRVPVFGLGCAGGVTGLAVARRLAAAGPGSRVLMVAVECCTLSFRMESPGKSDLIATALFGDGAAAAVLSAGPGTGPRIGEGQEQMWPDTLDIMGWSVDETGLGVIFDRAIPGFAAGHLRPALDAMLGAAGTDLAGLDRLVCHPGGTKVVEAIEAAADLEPGTLAAEREVLRVAGNMSAPTALFVLQRVLAEGARGRMAMLALGPGFTASLVPVEVE